MFPLFCCDELSNAQLLPMFFTKVSPQISLNLHLSPYSSKAAPTMFFTKALRLRVWLRVGLGLGLANAQTLPMFFTKADLAATWVAAGRPAASLPTDLQVTPLQP